ncbi:MAG: hypothetical protein WC835_03785 [Candidatus Paceibacterota bacterium]|jgi:hypothetical protein
MKKSPVLHVLHRGKTKQYLFLLASVAVLLLVLNAVIRIDKKNIANAGASHNLSGYAWSDNIGWLSFNCTDAGTCASGDYGVNVAPSGAFSGYAWSDNIGWVSFNSSDTTGCPTAPSCAATLNGANGNVSGWAKALSASGGWDGWISLSGTAADTSPYGVSFTGSTGSGYAWGSDVVGWLSFNGTNYGIQSSTPLFNVGPTVTITSPAISPINTDTVTPVGFSATSTVQSGSVIAYEWRSGNCQTGTLLSTSLSFQQLMPLGTTVVYFRAQDNQGVWSISCPSVTINTTAPSPINATCGATSGGSSGIAPATGLCATGSATTTPVLSGGNWVWGCQGLYGGTDINSCYATNTCGNVTCQRDKGESPSTCRTDCPIDFREI